MKICVFLPDPPLTMLRQTRASPRLPLLRHRSMEQSMVQSNVYSASRAVRPPSAPAAAAGRFPAPGRDVSDEDAVAAFRADLLAISPRLRAFAMSLVGD